MKLPSFYGKVKYFMFKQRITEFVIKKGTGHRRLQVFYIVSVISSSNRI